MDATPAPGGGWVLSWGWKEKVWWVGVEEIGVGGKGDTGASSPGTGVAGKETTDWHTTFSSQQLTQGS